MRDGWHKGTLPFDPLKLLRAIKVAVIVHLFYADLWGEIARRLGNIPIPFDLFVSVPQENAAALRAMVSRDYPGAQVLEVANAGRDVGAFFAVLPKVLAGNYSALCKLHSKKGREHPEAWRDLLFRGLLANKMLVARILHAFAEDPELALVGARQVYLSGPDRMMHNQEKVAEVADALFRGRRLPPRWGFFAGTMFWARPDFFRPFLLADPRVLSFEEDNTQHDGQLAHAFERMFGALATLAGKRIGVTDFTDCGPLDGMIHITQAPGDPWKGGFIRVLKSHALELSGQLPFKPRSGSHTRARPGASRPGQRLLEKLPIAALLPKWSERASERFPGLSRNFRRALKLLWWTATLQILSRVRNYRHRREEAGLVASSPLFDRSWYVDRYPDARAAGVDPAFHYVAYGAPDYRDPGPLFDTAWYTAYYADVAAAGVNPLVHYLRHGAKEGRHARPAQIVGADVAEAALVCRKAPLATGEIALFVTHSPDSRLKPHVRYYLEALRRHGVKIVLIVAADAEFLDADESLLGLVDGLYVRQNIGYDFAAWAHLLREHPALLDADILYLINDSMVGPLNEDKFRDLLGRVRSSKCDLVGLTDGYEYGWHIQSYFIALTAAALTSPALRAFMMNVKSLASKLDVVMAYETRFASALQQAGLRCEVLFPARKAGNPSLLDWRALIRAGLPFVKVAALQDQSRSFGKRNWRKVLQAEGFDCRLAEAVLADRSKPAS
jgi:lipopolysaccharide biosynthesis protein